MAWIKDAPNPGSNAALDMGCTCAVMDNNHGKWAPWPPDGWWTWPPDGWWTTAGCPVHDPAPKEDDTKE